MKSAKKIIAVILAVITVAACFAACSKDDAKPDTSDVNAASKVKVIDINLSDEEYALGVDKENAELLEQANAFIKEIKENGKLDEICNHYFGDGEPVGVTSAVEDPSKDQLIVATNAEFEPFEYKQGDQFCGIDMEIVQAFAQSIGKELVIKDMKFDAVVLSVQQQKADLAAAGLTVNPTRAEQVNFTESYYAASQQLIVKGDDTKFDACQSADDIVAILNEFDASVKIGGQNGTTGQSYIQGDEEFGFAGLKATFVGYDNGSLAVQDLINGGVDYVIIDAAPAAAITTAINAVA
ncbi:MAG: transporter substrate-binding domain-containing protein [Eubacterium sp.]|nr:transporter substrate-binding domain-containing protein [Eubacterium sp.]